MHYCPLKDAMALNRKEYQGLYNVYFLSLLTQFKIRVLFYWIHFPLRNIHIFILLTLSDQGCSLKGSWCVVLDNIFLCSCNALKAKYTRGLVTSFIPNMIFFPTDSFKEKKEEKKQVLLLFRLCSVARNVRPILSFQFLPFLLFSPMTFWPLVKDDMSKKPLW